MLSDDFSEVYEKLAAVLRYARQSGYHLAVVCEVERLARGNPRGV